MPLSRGRKGKKKKKPQQKRKSNSNYEEFSANGTKVYRQGKMFLYEQIELQNNSNNLLMKSKNTDLRFYNRLMIQLPKSSKFFLNTIIFNCSVGLGTIYLKSTTALRMTALPS